MPTFLPATISARTDWAPGLFSLRLDRTVPFAAGQFLTLASEPDGTRHTRRAYSVASAPGEPLEFLIVEVEDGAVSPLLQSKRPGDPIFVSDKGKGLFSLEDVPSAPDLWLLATGTGFAPYRSMLRHGELFDRFGRIILVYGVRTRAHMAYLPELEALSAAHPGQVLLQGLTSREAAQAGDLDGRITTRFADGSLERALGTTIDQHNSQVMLCGNPAMITEMLQGLGERGLHRNTRRSPGHVTTEKYW